MSWLLGSEIGSGAGGFPRSPTPRSGRSRRWSPCGWYDKGGVFAHRLQSTPDHGWRGHKI